MSTYKSIYFILIAVVMMFASCDNQRRTNTLKTQYKQAYLDQFKLTYFRQLLLKSYNNSNAVQEIIKKDHSGFTEPMLTEDDYKLIDSLTSIDNQKLIADSTDGRYRAEGAQGKRPLGYIMERLNSKWLDSLAKQRLKINGFQHYWVD